MVRSVLSEDLHRRTAVHPFLTTIRKRPSPSAPRRITSWPSTLRRSGRRERNKQDKLQRITAAARELFTEHGVDDVTTQQIADKADIGTGTLFLYAKNKGELLLLVQNSSYVDALAKGRAAAESVTDPLESVIAIIRPVVECNRVQIDNGRTYLREIVFGDPEEPHHREALALTVQTEEAIASVLQRDQRTYQTGRCGHARARGLGHHVRQHGGHGEHRPLGR